MPDDRGEVQEINYRQLLPWTQMFRVFGIALDLRKLLLAAAGILVMSLGWFILAQVLGPAEMPTESDFPIENFQVGEDDDGKAEERQKIALDAAEWRYWNYHHFRHMPWSDELGDNQNPFVVIRWSPRKILSYEDYWQHQIRVLLQPLGKFIRPVSWMLDGRNNFLSYIFIILGTLITLATWAIFGGAIARMAAVQFARNSRVGMMESLKFSASKFLSLFSAPLFPFAGVLLICFPMFLGGLFVNIPYVGDFLATILWPLALFGAFLMSIVLIGLIGWPMMYATISTEGSDSFDALSRSYSYVFQRPWHYAYYSLLAAVYGILVIYFVFFMTSMFVFLSKWAVATAGGDYFEFFGEMRLSKLFVFAPQALGWRDMLLESHSAETLRDSMNWAQYAGAGIMGFWLGLIFLLMLGFVYSFFWSAGTCIYFLLRKLVDDTDFDEVYIEEEEEDYTIPDTSFEDTTTSSTLPMTDPPASPPPTVESETPSAPPATDPLPPAESPPESPSENESGKKDSDAPPGQSS